MDLNTTGQRRRIQSVHNDPIYLVSYVYQDNPVGALGADAALRLQISGSTRTIYYVVIKSPIALNSDDVGTQSCTCIDFRIRGTQFLCKHICFVWIKVLQQASVQCTMSSDIWTNLRSILEQRADDQAMVDAIAAATSSTAPSLTAADNRPLASDDICPICYDECSSALVWFCHQCKNPIHAQCMLKWGQVYGSEQVPCVLCRALWFYPAAAWA